MDLLKWRKQYRDLKHQRRQEELRKAVDTFRPGGVTHCKTRTFSRLINTPHGAVKRVGQAPVNMYWNDWSRLDKKAMSS